MRSVTRRAGRGQLVAACGGLAVETPVVFRRPVVVAHPAVHELQVVVVWDLDAVEVRVAEDAVEVAVDRAREDLLRDVGRDLDPAAGGGHRLVVVAHQTLVVVLGREGREATEDQDQAATQGCQRMSHPGILARRDPGLATKNILIGLAGLAVILRSHGEFECDPCSSSP